MPSKSGKGRACQDAIDTLHTDNTLTDTEKKALQACLVDGVRAIGGFDTHSDKVITSTYNFFRGANPSLSVSITTA